MQNGIPRNHSLIFHLCEHKFVSQTSKNSVEEEDITYKTKFARRRGLRELQKSCRNIGAVSNNIYGQEHLGKGND
jgi:hypothetical protein